MCCHTTNASVYALKHLPSHTPDADESYVHCDGDMAESSTPLDNASPRLFTLGRGQWRAAEL